MLGNRVVLEALSAMARAKQDRATGSRWDPRCRCWQIAATRLANPWPPPDCHRRSVWLHGRVLRGYPRAPAPAYPPGVSHPGK